METVSEILDDLSPQFDPDYIPTEQDAEDEQQALEDDAMREMFGDESCWRDLGGLGHK